MDIRIFLIVFLLHLVQSKVIDLTYEQIRAFVDGHNSRRCCLVNGDIPNQPAATFLQPMYWDSELAEKATKWSMNTEFKHNPNFTIGSGRFMVGEDLFREPAFDEFDVNHALDTWFSEYKDYTYGPIKTEYSFDKPRKETGHYTQMVWVKSTYLGCGVSENLYNGLLYYFVVCNYDPAGNIEGQVPYYAGSRKIEKDNSCDCSPYQ